MLNLDTSPRDRQRQVALETANHHRSAAAQLKRQLRHRTITLAEILHDPPQAVASQMTLEVLGWAPGIGRHRLQMLNVRAVRTGYVNLAAPLGSLTDRQRQWLARELTDRR